MCVRGRGTWEISVPSTRFCYELKAAVNSKINSFQFFKNEIAFRITLGFNIISYL